MSHAVNDLPVNLRRIMARDGLSVAEVVARTGLDARTVRSLMHGEEKRPHSRTLHRLATGLGIEADELFQNPATLANRLFDRESNPLVDELVAERPELFRDWTEAEFDELYSRVGTGGALTSAGALEVVAAMNRHREIHEKVALVLESSEADVLAAMVEVLYEKVKQWPVVGGQWPAEQS